MPSSEGGKSDSEEERDDPGAACRRRRWFRWQAPAALVRFFQQRIHLFVTEAEVVADFVDEDVRDEVRERDIAALDPFVENGAAIEQNHWRLWGGVHDRASGEIDPGIEPGQLEWVVDAEIGERCVVGKVLDAEDHVASERAEFGRQRRPRLARKAVEIIERGWDFGHRWSILLARAPRIGLAMEDL